MSKLWSGRFDRDITDSVLDYTHTVDIDIRLVKGDYWNNLAHVLMLSHQHIIPQEDGRLLVQCLLGLQTTVTDNLFELEKQFEDVHFNFEQHVINALGLDVGGKMHTARSRNDQVATDTRLYVREALLGLHQTLRGLVATLLAQAAAHLSTPMVGYTHGQPAQPVSVGYWLSGYASIFTRDLQRLIHAYRAVNISPLGACALAGTSFPISRQMTRELLAFDDLLLHALDATSSRDFLLEALYALVSIAANLSKLAEEIVIFSSFEFGLIEVDDSFTTGSSIMPQKKNPVVAELVRARTGRVYGALQQLLTTVKGVPMGYNCDLQEDKPPVWAALDTVQSSVAIMDLHMRSMQFKGERAVELCWSNFTTATDLANYLVQEHGLSFRQSHHVVGRLVGLLIKDGASLEQIDLVQRLLGDMGHTISADRLKTVLDPRFTLERYTSEGATSVASVRHIVETLQSSLAEQHWRAQQCQDQIAQGWERTHAVARRFAAGASIAEALASAR